jgi:hypothetical protein
MCFIDHDYDWVADIQEETTITSDKPIRCEECGRIIEPGNLVHHIWQQEHEECHGGDCDPIPGSYECDAPDYGESAQYDCCHDCHEFLDAVEASELEAGCRRSEARPSLCGMVIEISEMPRHEARRYWFKAGWMFPALRASGYLDWLWERMFGNEDDE